MTDSRVFRLRRLIMEITHGRHKDDPPDRDNFLWLMHQIHMQAIDLPKRELIDLEEMARKMTGVRVGQ